MGLVARFVGLRRRLQASLDNLQILHRQPQGFPKMGGVDIPAPGGWQFLWHCRPFVWRRPWEGGFENVHAGGRHRVESKDLVRDGENGLKPRHPPEPPIGCGGTLGGVKQGKDLGRSRSLKNLCFYPPPIEELGHGGEGL